MSRDEQAEWLLLEESKEFRGYWQVDSLWPEYFFDFEPLIGAYRLVSPATLPEFLKRVAELDYHVAFVGDPTDIMDAYEYLKTVPNVQMNSNLDTNDQGFFFWQVTGFNKLIRNEDIKAGLVVWLTGGGKAFFIASALKFHQEHGHEFDLGVITVKSHNKIDTQRKLKTLADIDAIVVDGKADKRWRMYEEIEQKVKNGERPVVIINYEKWREDTSYLKSLVGRQNVLFFWDEAPAKLSNRKTQLYRGIKKALYRSFYSKPGPKWMRHWVLTATPIENSPEDIYSCVNLVWPGLLGSVGEFHSTYVAGHNQISGKPERWKNLDRLEAKLQFITHRASKDDPEIAAMFPEELPMPTPIDWNPKHRAIYDRLTGKAKDLVEEFEDLNILAMIQVMQMICDAPSMVQKSAENRQAFEQHLTSLEVDEDIPFTGPTGSDVAMLLLDHLGKSEFTDAGHSKLETWREIIVEKHPDDKVITHSTWAEYIFPVWQYWLDKWGVSYVTYNGTGKQKQEALDAFRDDPSIQVFLSGDAGADSIDIDIARVGVNYNIPWKWTTIQQRVGRRDRVTSAFDTIYTYTLTMPDSVDERKLEICDKKYSYHTQLFDGKARDEMQTTKMTREDLLYMLFG